MNPAAGKSVGNSLDFELRRTPNVDAVPGDAGEVTRIGRGVHAVGERTHSPINPCRGLTMATIDIDTLTEHELHELNHRVVARLRALRDMRAHVGMLEFHVGERVAFQPPGHRMLQGVLSRYNRKTVTVMTDDHGQWNVAPSFLRKVGAATGGDASGTNVVLMATR
jgi:hypothetical protein